MYYLTLPLKSLDLSNAGFSLELNIETQVLIVHFKQFSQLEQVRPMLNLEA